METRLRLSLVRHGNITMVIDAFAYSDCHILSIARSSRQLLLGRSAFKSCAQYNARFVHSTMLRYVVPRQAVGQTTCKIIFRRYRVSSQRLSLYSIVTRFRDLRGIDSSIGVRYINS